MVTSGTTNNSSITLQSVELLNNERPVLIENAGVKLTVRNTQFRGNTAIAISTNGLGFFFGISSVLVMSLSSRDLLPGSR